MSKEGKIGWKRAAGAILAVCAGTANVLFGGGGGMLVVPALGYGLESDEKKAHAGAIAVTFPLSLISLIVHTLRGTWDLNLAWKVGTGAVVGAAIGAGLLRKVPRRLLSVLFYGVMVYAGIRYLI